VIVLDSSAAVDYLVSRERGEWVEQELVADGDVHVPHLIDVEITNALRNLVRRGELHERRARGALEDLADLDVARYSHVEFLERIWQLRTNMTAYDATFVALAEALGAALLTTDDKLAHAPGIRAAIIAP